MVRLTGRQQIIATIIDYPHSGLPKGKMGSNFTVPFRVQGSQNRHLLLERKQFFLEPAGTALSNFILLGLRQYRQTGLEEVARIRRLMDSVKIATGYKGDLNSFFEYMRTDKRFMPFKTSKEILDAFANIHQTIKPHLETMFKRVPRSAFEIRQTESFRAASASPEYFSGSADGSRPGIFYVPILD